MARAASPDRIQLQRRGYILTAPTEAERAFRKRWLREHPGEPPPSNHDSEARKESIRRFRVVGRQRIARKRLREKIAEERAASGVSKPWMRGEKQA